jgi:asparagine synthetase B (glutamine-hydrolysing)
MGTPEGDLWITYNGEIYNYIELRKELAGKGHVFRTASDTEVILHAYREWGGVPVPLQWDVGVRTPRPPAETPLLCS